MTKSNIEKAIRDYVNKNLDISGVLNKYGIWVVIGLLVYIIFENKKVSEYEEE